MALQSFYEELTDITDEFAEVYQGEYGLIADYPSTYTPVKEPLKLVEGLSSWIGANRYKCCDEEDTHLQNIIDEIVALCARTAYKLRFLK